MEILNIEKQRLTIAEMRRKLEEDRQNALGMSGSELDRENARLAQDEAALKVAENGLELAKKAGTDSQKILNTVSSSIESNLISNINAVIDGTKSMKQGFADMAVAVLKNISDIIVKLLVMKALEATGMSMFASPAAPPVAKLGGVFSEGKKTYAGGGVARGPRSGYPATLHGTEAVVPLPGGRAIPVNMTGGANNIVVNVSGDGGMQTQGGDQEGLGRAIASAVQTELQNQKRSGGLLNPYGVA